MAHSHAPKILKPLPDKPRRRRTHRTKNIAPDFTEFREQLRAEYTTPSKFMKRLEEWKNETNQCIYD